MRSREANLRFSSTRAYRSRRQPQSYFGAVHIPHQGKVLVEGLREWAKTWLICKHYGLGSFPFCFFS